MVEITDGLWVGNQQSAEMAGGETDRPFYRVLAAKDPWHRKALGYTTRGAPKDSPEYLIAYRGRDCILNLIDADDPRFIPDALVDAALRFIFNELHQGHRVGVFCNEGQSRAPSLVLLYLHRYDEDWWDLDLADALAAFKELYPAYAPHNGLARYLEEHWDYDPAQIEHGPAVETAEEELLHTAQSEADIDELGGW